MIHKCLRLCQSHRQSLPHQRCLRHVWCEVGGMRVPNCTKPWMEWHTSRITRVRRRTVQGWVTSFFSILCTFKRNLIKHRPQTIITPFPGERGLEIRGNGSRSTIPLDFHDSRCSGNRRYYFTGAHLIWHPCPHRYHNDKHPNGENETPSSSDPIIIILSELLKYKKNNATTCVC